MRTHRRWRWVLGVLGGVLWVFLSTGCGSGPKAPALRDEPVYQNDQAGFRFLVPENWARVGSGVPPPGKIAKDFLLARYVRKVPDRRAALEVTVVDLPRDTDLALYLASPSFGVKHWQQVSKAETLEGLGAPAQRYVFIGRVGHGELNREVVVFQRGKRSYFFTGLFPPTDASARELLRRAVESTIWKN